jgi:hypothetical protein
MRHSFGLAIALAAGSASAQLAGASISITGAVNGEALEATGEGVVDLGNDGMSQVSLTFNRRPLDFDTRAPSLLSNICANAFRADDDTTDNLFDLSGGNYNVSRTFQWIGATGVIFMDSVVSFDGSTFNSDSVISGNYGGPTDIIGIQDYRITWLPSSTPGEFFESGTAILDRASGGTIILQFASIYSGLKSSLRRPQFGIGSFDTEFENEKLSVGWDGEFAIPAPATAALLGFAGVAAARRRR